MSKLFLKDIKYKSNNSVAIVESKIQNYTNKYWQMMRREINMSFSYYMDKI